MHALLLYFAVAGALPLQPDALPVAPFDIAVGHQVVELRDTMIARSPGVRMGKLASPATGEASCAHRSMNPNRSWGNG